MNASFAIVFPGQGSQSVGMLKEISDQYPIVKQTFDQASSMLGYDLWELTQQGPATVLDQTVHTQPALLVASYAIWQILRQYEMSAPAFLAGHSLGEYTALVCAEALSFESAVKLVAARGQFMQDAVKSGEGAMAAIIGLDENVITEICESIALPQEVLSPANFNSIGQVVIAGHVAAVERAMKLAKEKGAKLVVQIPVSVPSHCELMQPAAEQLAQLLDQTEFKTPQIPVVNNVDVSVYTDAASIRMGLTKQLYKPVRWVETIQYFAKQGVTRIIECGPGKILTGLNKRIDKSLQLVSVTDAENFEALVRV